MFKSKEKKAAEAKAKAAAAEKARAAQAEAAASKREAAVIKEIESAAWDHVIVRRDALAALKAGLKVYQYMDAVSSIKGDVIPMIGTMATDERGATRGRMGKVAAGRPIHGPVPHIEAAGWRLVDAGYVYQQTHAHSRDKLMASGQQEAFSGRIMAIYTFRATDSEDTI